MKALTAELFVSGGMDGDLLSWSAKKKRPKQRLPLPHGPRWTTALGTLFNSNVLASGSHDNRLALYLMGREGLRPLPLECASQGFVNELSWARDGRVLVAAEGDWPRLGCWVGPNGRSQLRLLRTGLA